MTIQETQIPPATIPWRPWVNHLNLMAFQVLESFPVIGAVNKEAAGPQTDLVVWTHKLSAGIISFPGEGIDVSIHLMTASINDDYTVKLEWASVAAGATAPAGGAYVDFLKFVSDFDVGIPHATIFRTNLYGALRYYLDSGTPKMQATATVLPLLDIPAITISSQAGANANQARHLAVTRNPTAKTVSGSAAQDVYVRMTLTYAANTDFFIRDRQVKFIPRAIVQ